MSVVFEMGLQNKNMKKFFSSLGSPGSEFKDCEEAFKVSAAL